MPIAHPPLPYALDALAPHISAETLEYHHGKHHKAYVDKANAAIAETDLADAALEDIVRSADASGNTALFNNAAQAWNHSFYWNSLTPRSTAPNDGLMAAIAKDFGSLDTLKAELGETAKGHFASGWAWLIACDDDQLRITDTHDAGTAVTQNVRPLLVVDVWEHAYYIDRRNDRPAYVGAVAGLLNWDFASENFARKEPWVHP